LIYVCGVRDFSSWQGDFWAVDSFAWEEAQGFHGEKGIYASSLDF